MSLIRRLVCYVMLALFVDRVIRLIYMLEFHRTVYTHHPGTCKELTGIVNGSEDIVIASNGVAFISSGVMRMLDQGFTGRIYVFDANQPDDPPREARITGPGIDVEELVPHGMDIWEVGPKDDPMISLYVINKQRGNIGIEVFDYTNERNEHVLKHKRTIQHDALFKPNDVVVVDEHRFYVTNDAYLRSPFDVIEYGLNLGLASVAYYDGSDGRIVANRIQFANGINLSRDKKLLYVAAFAEPSVRVFKIRENGDLDLIQVIPLYTPPDNIDVDKEDGSLWIGCHPNVYHLLNPSRSTGVGQVLNVRLDEDLHPHIREVFADTTGLIRGSSVACRHGNALLVGTVNQKAAYCELDEY